MASYSFEYGSVGVPENIGIAILDYKYGDSHKPGTYVEKERVAMGPVWQGGGGRGTHAWMPVGGSLYVKWRIISTGKVYEDTVDLTNRLPSDMENKTIHFLIKGPQLYVYLISTQGHALRGPDCPVHTYSDYGCTELYPGHWKNF
jgi:hypothetical protein